MRYLSAPCSPTCSTLNSGLPPTTAANWLGSLLPQVSSIQVPPMTTIQRGTGTYWQDSDFRLVLNLQATRLSGAGAFCGAALTAPGLYPIEVQQNDGTRDATKTASLWQFMCERRGTIFYNEIPVGAVDGTPSDTIASNPLFPASNATTGGLVFFLSVQGSESTSANNHYGVRIFDSANLNTRGSTFPYPSGALPADPTGLTVVSDQGMYIEGNYNSTNWYPAAVIADTINVLSQGWEVPSATVIGGINVANDRKSVSPSDATGLGATRVVPGTDGNTSGQCGNNSTCPSFTTTTALTINAALISGIADFANTSGVTDNTTYNGGLENYLRFHESWTGKQLNYSGSFVTLGFPQHQTNDWACGSGVTCAIYDPPTRVWNYDTRFNTVTNLPPLTPKVTYIQQDLYTRFYK